MVVTGGLRFGMATCDKNQVHRDKKSVSETAERMTAPYGREKTVVQSTA